MDKITKINSGEKFTHTSVGKLAEFNGKQFLKDTVGTTGCEISFGTIEPGQAAPFFHSHKKVVSNNVLWRTVKSPNKKQNGSKTRRLFYVIQEQPPLTS